MFALKAVVGGILYSGRFVLAVRRMVNPNELGKVVSTKVSESDKFEDLEDFLAKDWMDWGRREEAKHNKVEVKELADVTAVSALDVNESWAKEDITPCTSYTPCVNGKRGWFHTCSEKVERSDPETWKPIVKELGCVHVAFQVGDEKGPFFTLENEGRTMSQVFATFSGGKRPGAVAAARSVAAGNMTWDTKASEVFEWWTKDENDPRSQVTFADFLHFTDGFTVDAPLRSFDHEKHKHKCLNSMLGYTYTLEECAKQLYEVSSHRPRDTVYQYNSLHSQFALAMAVKRSGLTATQYLNENLYEPCQMNDSYYGGKDNPFVAGGMMTTGNDYASFLRALMGYTILPKEVLDVMETEYRNAHGIPDIGTIVRMPDWAMAQYHLPYFDDCLNMGGSQHNCVDRKTGTYWMLLPEVKEYYGRAMGGLHASVLMHARNWIHDDLIKAIQEVHPQP